MIVEWPETTEGLIAVIGAILATGIWIGKVNSDRKSFREFMQKMEKDIREIFERLPARAVIEDSPLRLSVLGDTITKELNARGWAAEVAKTLAPAITTKTQYHVQEICFWYVENELSVEMVRAVRKKAYEHGLSKDQVLSVLAIVLRDRLLTMPRTFVVEFVDGTQLMLMATNENHARAKAWAISIGRAWDEGRREDGRKEIAYVTDDLNDPQLSGGERS